MSGQCPIGWVPYYDNGIEGHDSCLMYNVTAVSFGNASCPYGTHLVTILAPNTSVSLLYNAFLSVSNFYTNGTHTWLGARQAPHQPHKNVGWSWVDGTSNANLYNGTNNITGYGMWSAHDISGRTGQPEYVDRQAASATRESPCTLTCFTFGQLTWSIFTLVFLGTYSGLRLT